MCSPNGPIGLKGRILIESQWNLNETDKTTYSNWYKILIESQWNLNGNMGDYRNTEFQY